jgi:hypothetical protein
MHVNLARLCLMPVAALLLLSGCAENSEGGFTVGRVYSPMWFVTAPEQDKVARLRNADLPLLCSDYSMAYYRPNESQIRLFISRELVGRGKSPRYCSDPSEDSRRDVDAARADAAAARKEAEEARSEARSEREYNDCVRTARLNKIQSPRCTRWGRR